MLLRQEYRWLTKSADVRDFISAKRFAFLAISLLYIASLIGRPTFAAADLDTSWMMATSYGWHKGLSFGRDIVFTYGPLSFLSTHYFEGSNYILSILNDILLAGIVVWPLFSYRTISALVLYISTLCILPLSNMDALAFTSIVTVFLVMMKANNVRIIILCIALTPTSLAKFSYILAILPLLALVDINSVVTRKMAPVATVFYCFSVITLMAITNVFSNGIPSNWEYILHIISGYSHAMQTNGIGPLNKSEIALIHISIILALIWYILIFFRIVKHDAQVNNSPKLEKFIYLAGLTWFAFIVFKAGFTRLDYVHLAITWSSIALSIPMIILSFDNTKMPLSPFMIEGVLLILACSLGLSYFSNAANPSISQARKVSHSIALYQQMAAVSSLVDSRSWSAMRNEQARRIRDLGANVTLDRRLKVDALPSDVAPIIAAGMRYTPRPVVQSYSSYTRGLQNLDAEFIKNRRLAPDIIYANIGATIDNRLPTLDFGPTISILRQYYFPIGIDNSIAVLKRRQYPLQVSSINRKDVAIKFGEWITIPPAFKDNDVFATISLPQNLFGTTSSFLLRENTLSMNVIDDSGKIYTYRFIPSMSNAEILLSPLPKPNITNYINVTNNIVNGKFDSRQLYKVKAFQITGNVLSSYSFDIGHLILTEKRFRISHQ